MELVTLEEARAYLRVDSTYEDALIASLISTATAFVLDIGRVSMEEVDNVASLLETGSGTVTIRDEERDYGEVEGWLNTLHVGVLFALGYLYEHRDEADHHALALSLRALLFAVREGVV